LPSGQTRLTAPFVVAQRPNNDGIERKTRGPGYPGTRGICHPDLPSGQTRLTAPFVVAQRPNSDGIERKARGPGCTGTRGICHPDLPSRQTRSARFETSSSGFPPLTSHPSTLKAARRGPRFVQGWAPKGRDRDREETADDKSGTRLRSRSTSHRQSGILVIVHAKPHIVRM
jgi:hypothetical protein